MLLSLPIILSRAPCCTCICSGCKKIRRAWGTRSSSHSKSNAWHTSCIINFSRALPLTLWSGLGFGIRRVWHCPREEGDQGSPECAWVLLWGTRWASSSEGRKVGCGPWDKTKVEVRISKEKGLDGEDKSWIRSNMKKKRTPSRRRKFSQWFLAWWIRWKKYGFDDSWQYGFVENVWIRCFLAGWRRQEPDSLSSLRLSGF